METITIKAVFDRKGEADAKNKRGLVQIRITYKGKSAYVSTGVKLLKNQWDKGKECVKNSLQADEYNHIINAYLAKILQYKDMCIRDGVLFDFAAMKRGLYVGEKRDTFLGFMEKRIRERGDIRNSTRKAHLSVLRTLKAFGRIVDFGDLTFANIRLLDDCMHTQGLKQTTIWGKHKIIKSTSMKL